MIIGAHVVISSTNPEADGACLRDVLGLTHIDDGGYLICGLPPSEVSVHPSDENDAHRLYLMCADVKAFVAEMGKRRLVCDPVRDEGWGLLTQLTLPGGGKVGVYEPRHARPKAMSARTAAARRAHRAATKPTPRPPQRRRKKAAR